MKLSIYGLILLLFSIVNSVICFGSDGPVAKRVRGAH